VVTLFPEFRFSRAAQSFFDLQITAAELDTLAFGLLATYML